ncbi:hypothetical protein D3C73_957100 [compost metagenome]
MTPKTSIIHSSIQANEFLQEDFILIDSIRLIVLVYDLLRIQIDDVGSTPIQSFLHSIF